MRCLDAQGPCKELLATAAQQYSIERQIWKWEICFNWLCSSDALHGPWASEHLLCTSTRVKTNKTDTKWSDMNDINFHQQLKQWKQYFDVFVFFLGTICHLTKNRNNINRTFKSNSNCILKEAHKTMRKRLCGLCQNVYKNVI